MYFEAPLRPCSSIVKYTCGSGSSGTGWWVPLPCWALDSCMNRWLSRVSRADVGRGVTALLDFPFFNPQLYLLKRAPVSFAPKAINFSTQDTTRSNNSSTNSDSNKSNNPSNRNNDNNSNENSKNRSKSNTSNSSNSSSFGVFWYQATSTSSSPLSWMRTTRWRRFGSGLCEVLLVEKILHHPRFPLSHKLQQFKLRVPGVPRFPPSTVSWFGRRFPKYRCKSFFNSCESRIVLLGCC